MCPTLASQVEHTPSPFSLPFCLAPSLLPGLSITACMQIWRGHFRTPTKHFVSVEKKWTHFMMGQHRSVETVSPNSITFFSILKNSVFRNASLPAAGFGHPSRVLVREELWQWHQEGVQFWCCLLLLDMVWTECSNWERCLKSLKCIWCLSKSVSYVQVLLWAEMIPSTTALRCLSFLWTPCALLYKDYYRLVFVFSCET